MDKVSNVVKEGLAKDALPQAPSLDDSDNYSDALLYVNGKDKPPLTDVQVREFLEIADEVGGRWPFNKGLATDEFQKRYRAVSGGWMPEEAFRGDVNA